MTTSSAAHLQAVTGALSRPRTASTFELQMLRDQVRRRELAERMRQLREESPYTQEAIADKIGLKLRSYQKAEQTGGISYEKLQALARVHEVGFDWLLKGSDQGAAPNLLATMEGERSSDEQLDRIERMLEETQQLMWLVARHAGVITDTESPREFVERAVDEFIREREEDATAEAPTPQAIPHAPSRRAGTKR